MFDVSWDLSSIVSMSITYCKKVGVSHSTKMRNCNIWVLVQFSRICWRYSCFCSKWKLCNAIVNSLKMISWLDYATIKSWVSKKLPRQRSSWEYLRDSICFFISIVLLWKCVRLLPPIFCNWWSFWRNIFSFLLCFTQTLFLFFFFLLLLFFCITHIFNLIITILHYLSLFICLNKLFR